MESEYLKRRRAMKLQGAELPKEKREKQKVKGDFYSSQIAQAPKVCEECGNRLAGTMAINPAAVVAHIIPKRPKGGCPSVSTHKNNVFFACGDCHTNYDNKGAAFVKNMLIFEVLKQRVQTFYHIIPENERPNVPVYFIPDNPKKDAKINTTGKRGKAAKKGK